MGKKSTIFSNLGHMTQLEEQFHKIITEIPGAREGKAFGANCIKAKNSKTAAIFWQDRVLFKLDRSGQKEAMQVEGALPGTHLFSPDREMKGWVWLPAEQAELWPDFAKMAVDYVGSLKG